jgi:Mn-dependent DtxR family transcriptional regulator
MLQFLSTHTYFTATQLAKEWSEMEGVPASTCWYNLRALHKKGLLECGQGKPVQLTAQGKFLAQQLMHFTSANAMP